VGLFVGMLDWSILASLCWFCAALGLVPSGLAEASACCFVRALFVWVRFSPQCPDCLVCWSCCMDVLCMLITKWFLMLVQGSLFPLISVQQACLAYVLFKGLCSLFLYCWSPAYFWSIIFLHSIKKKSNKWLKWTKSIYI
jgi:hypothetical protein